MFYIVETVEQLDKVISYGNTDVFIDIIPLSDDVHPVLNKPSLIYFRPIKAKRGFIIAIDHTETFSLDYNLVLTSLINTVPHLYVIDKKDLLYYGIRETGCNSLKMASVLNGRSFPEWERFDTPAHKFYRRKLNKRLDVNRFIPVSKHYEKYEDFFEDLGNIQVPLQSKDYTFYNDIVPSVLYNVEINGIGLAEDHTFNGLRKELSCKDAKIFSKYNIFNLTARPSNKFNGVNFLGLKRKSGERRSLVPVNDLFVEFDYKAYQAKLLADLLGFDFRGIDIHRYLAGEYFPGEEITESLYDEGKLLTFKYLYGRSDEVPDIPFFKQVYDLREFLWTQYQHHGYIKAPMSGRKIMGVEEITQILPYLMQCMETERNIGVMSKIDDLLTGKRTKLVLYSYDAFLFDVSYEDGHELISELKLIMEEGGYQTSIKYGDNYHEMQSYAQN